MLYKITYPDRVDYAIDIEEYAKRRGLIIEDGGVLVKVVAIWLPDENYYEPDYEIVGLIHALI